MKKFIVHTCLPAIVLAMTAGNALAQYTEIFGPVPASYNSIRSEIVKKPGIKSATQYAGLTADQKLSTVTYTDGMGRVFAKIGVQANPFRYDMVTFTDFDTLGRVEISFLPYASNRNDGWFRGHAVTMTDIEAFYDNPGDMVADDTVPYAIPVYDFSPFGYLHEQGAPGAAWQPGGGHTATRTFRFNDTNEVRVWKTDLTSSAYYAANQLMIDETTDENGNMIKSITDKTGRLLEKHVQVGTSEWLKTLYIYDERGQLYCILQPEGVRQLGSGTTIGTAISDDHAFFFTYDAEGRVVEKIEPGKTSQYYCYDPLGRLVLSQDGYLRERKQWLYIKYDRYHRAIMQGIYTNTSDTTRTVMQSILDTLSYQAGETFYEKKQNGGTLGYSNQSFPWANIDPMAATYYDDYDLDESGSDDYAYTSQSLSLIIPGDTLTEGTQFKTRGKVTATKTKILGTSDWLVAYIFYDQFGRAIQVRSNNHRSLTPDNLVTSLYDFTGTVWLTKKYHNAGSGRIATIINRYEYDHVGRVKRVFQKNNSDDEEQLVSYRYNELGQVVAKNLHCLDCSEEDTFADGSTSYADDLVSDDNIVANSEFVGRTNVYLRDGFSVGGGTTLTVRIDAQETESVVSGKYIQSVDYRYNIRGWIASINNAQLTDDQSANDDTGDYFGMELLYNTAEAGLSNTEYYNGNISAIKWKGPTAEMGSTGQRSYKFTYDKSDRLLQAAYQVKTASDWTGEANAQNEVMTYDHNGNIKTLERSQRKWEWTGVEPEYTHETIDSLLYSYANNGNRLTRVHDRSAGAAAEAGFKDGIILSHEYTYNINGSLQADKNKGIDSVIYNVLGKPDSIKFSDGRKLAYLYDAGGSKLTMEVWQNTTLLKTTDYVNGFVYENDTLQFFSSPEGRVILNADSVFEYQYAITDHQGNTRVVFSSVVPGADTVETDFESGTSAEFLNYTNRNGMSEMNHTPAGTYSQLLHGGYSSQVGAARTIHVYPGDTIKAEVYAKYRNVTGTTSNLAGFAAALASAFGVSSGSTGEALNAYNSLDEFGGFIAGGDRPDDDGAPKGFITILLFDKHHNFLDAAWDQIDEAYEQTGVLDNDPFDLLQQQMVVNEEGYAYIFVSNENPTQVDIHFDDLMITHTKTKVVQYNEYYPFGLQTSNSWTRENSSNDFLYNSGNELNETSGWYETFFRGYDAALGRFLQVDPKAVKYNSFTGYNYGFNEPVFWNDPSGADPGDEHILYWQIYDRYGFDAANNWQMFGNLYGVTTSPTLLRAGTLRTGGGGSGGGGGGSSMSAAEFLVNGWYNSKFGGRWSNGRGYFFRSSLEALQAGIAYNDRHNSWDRTAYGSAAASFVAFGIISESGKIPSPDEVQNVLNPLRLNLIACASCSPDPEPWYVGAWNSYWYNLSHSLGLHYLKNVKKVGLHITGKGLDQYALRKMGIDLSVEQQLDMNDDSSVFAILNLLTASNALDAIGGFELVYEWNPLNRTYWGIYGPVPVWYEDLSNPGYYFSFFQPADSPYLYELVKRDGNYLMVPVPKASLIKKN